MELRTGTKRPSNCVGFGGLESKLPGVRRGSGRGPVKHGRLFRGAFVSKSLELHFPSSELPGFETAKYAICALPPLNFDQSCGALVSKYLLSPKFDQSYGALVSAPKKSWSSDPNLHGSWGEQHNSAKAPRKIGSQSEAPRISDEPGHRKTSFDHHSETRQKPFKSGSFWLLWLPSCGGPLGAMK